MGDAAAFLRRIPKRERERPREGGETGKGKGKLQVGIQGTEYPPPPKKNKQSSATASPIPEGKGGREKVAHQWSRRSGGEGIEEEDRGRQKCTSMRGRSHAHTAEGGGGGRSRLGECCFGKKRRGKRKRGASQSSHFFAGLFFSPFSRPNSPGRREKSRRRPSACLGGKGGEQNFCHSFLWSKFLTGRGDFLQWQNWSNNAVSSCA